MSTNLNTITVTNNEPVHVTAFNGGQTRGQCIQLVQGDVTDPSITHLTREQVAQMVATLSDWLSENKLA